jgi:hypothetical protein
MTSNNTIVIPTHCYREFPIGAKIIVISGGDTVYITGYDGDVFVYASGHCSASSWYIQKHTVATLDKIETNTWIIDANSITDTS